MVFYSLREKFYFFNFPVFLFCLIPFFLISGPFLSDLAISSISLLFLIYCIKKKNFSYFENKYFYFFLILWIYLIFNSLINNQTSDGLKISFFYFRYGVFVIAILAFLDISKKFLRYFFYCIFICFVSLILDGFYQYFVGENFFGLKYEHYRVSSFFGDEKILGSYLSRLWPIFFGLSILFYQEKKKIFLILVLIFILSEVLIFLSGDRTSFFYINLSSFFIILLSQKLLKLRILTILSSFLLIIFISFINPTAKERVIDLTFKQMNLLDENKRREEGIYIFSKQHTHHYITSYKMFLDNKVLGVGIKNFRNLCNEENYKISNLSCSTHPHNTYIQILTETGIFGFLFLVVVLFYFLKNVIRHLKYKLNGDYYYNDFQIIILSGIFIYLWPFVPTGNVFNNWLNIILILNIPLFIYGRKISKGKFEK